jgi:broad specificity phosphatase PhoE
MTSLVPLFSSRFLFVRHGESEANAEKVIGGSRDVPLTDVGRQEAAEAAARLANERIGSVFASPMLRTWETAEIIAASKEDLEVQAVAGITERRYGVWEGQPKDQFDRAQKPDGGESPEEFNARTIEALQPVTGRSPVLIVAHSGTFRALRVHLFGVVAYDSVPNAQPIEFLPPSSTGESWTIQPVG